MRKRIISIALCLCMALTLLPTAALAADTAATSVWVNGVELNSTTPYLASNNATSAVATQPTSGGYAYFNNGTLTLNNYQNSTSMNVQTTLGVHKIVTTGTAPETSDIWAAIYAEGDLNLVLSGTSTVNTKDGTDNNLAREAACVYVTGALTVSGSGSAALNTGKSFYPGTGEARETCPCNYGVYAGSLTVESGTLKLEPATTSTTPAMNPSDPDITTTTAKTVENTNGGGRAFAYGIYSADSININGGSVTAKSASGSGSADTNPTIAYGIYAAGTLSVAAGVAVTAGNYANNMTFLSVSCGIYSGGAMTLSGTVTAEAAATSHGTTTGMESAAGLTIDGSAVVSATAKGSTACTATNAYGVKGDSVTISGSAQVTASAYAESYSYGVYGDTVTLEGEAVISAKAYGSASDPAAVNAETELTVPTRASYTNKSAESTATQILATDKTQPVVINCDPSVRISFNACNGNDTESIIVSELTALPAPTLTGYTFAGWYPAPNGENAAGEAFTDAHKLTLAAAQALTASATYYAKWTAEAGGKTVRTTPLVIDSYTNDIDKSGTQGWKWIKDTKTLTLSGANIVTAGQYALNLNVDSVSIVLTEGSVNALSAAGGSFSTSAGLYSDGTSVTISGAGTLNATGGKASASAGIIATLTVEDRATVTATGSSAVSDSCGIKGSLTLTSGAVTANGSKYGLDCGYATINGGTLNATGAAAGINSSGAVTIESGATVTATGTGDAAGSCGLKTNSTLEVNGTLTAEGGTGAYSYGADIVGALSGSGSITATGGTATGDSAGLRFQQSTFSGTLIATGGAGSASYGILGTGSSGMVTMPTTITASCDATANRHFPVWVAGGFSNLTTQTFPGSIASKDGMIVYDDDTVLASNGYFDFVPDNVPFSALTIKADKTLTIAPTAKLYVASAEAITMETAEETTGKLVNNGWLVLNEDTKDTGATIAALGITGDGNIQAGDSVYSNAGVKNETAIPSGLDLSDGEAETATGKYTYADDVLTIEEGVIVIGNVILPAGRENAVVLENGASVLGDLSIEGAGEGKLNITVDSGDSASIGGVKVQQEVMSSATPKNFTMTIGGGGTLASGGISLSFADDYDANDPYDMSVILEKNTTLNITNSLDVLGAGMTINASANTGGLTVRGTMAVHTPNTRVSLLLPRITLECGASLSAGCQVAAELLASPGTGKALTMESGSTFIANGTKASIVIVVHPGQSIEDLVSLPSGYLPSGVSFREFHSEFLPNAKLYTLARQDDVLVDESNETAYIPTGGEASVTLRNYNVVGIHTLTFEVNGGSAIPAVSKTDGTTVDLSAYAPTREGYTFAGWYSDEALTMRVTELKMTKNTTVYAKWSDGTLPFVDVPEDAYYKDAVIWAVDEGITEGTSATTFSPDAICTRAQAVTFLWRASGSPAPKTTAMPFSDVPIGSYYYDAVLWAVEQGIIKGTSETTFSPDMNCSRSQIVTMLWRMEGSKAVTTANPFTDVSGDAYYASAVAWAVDEGITEGTSATTFSPDDNCTRAQIVTFIYRDIK